MLRRFSVKARGKPCEGGWLHFPRKSYALAHDWPWRLQPLMPVASRWLSPFLEDVEQALAAAPKNEPYEPSIGTEMRMLINVSASIALLRAATGPTAGNPEHPFHEPTTGGFLSDIGAWALPQKVDDFVPLFIFDFYT
jgi:hypothetical protein